MTKLSYPTLFRLAGHLPLWLLHAVGTLAGLGQYALSARYRRNFKRNLRQALGALPGWGWRCQALAHAGRTVAELPWVWRDRGRLLRRVRQIDGIEHVQAALGRGVVFLTPHLGCFEVCASYLGTHAPITVLYRKPKQDWVEPVMVAGRGGGGVELAGADMPGVKKLVRSLKSGGWVGLLPDQVPRGGEGQWAPFFGRPAYTMTLAARLSQLQADLLLVYAERLSFGRGYRLHFMPPVEPVSGTLEARVAAINRNIEHLIERCPQQYLWGYHRYKQPRGVAPPPGVE